MVREWRFKQEVEFGINLTCAWRVYKFTTDRYIGGIQFKENAS
jgi:hypothetical protein